jgi:hypothetical protein
VGLIASAFILAPACGQHDLRGTWKPSPDGKTYLVVDDDYGGDRPLVLDGHPWTAKKGVAAPISPGVHVLGRRGIDSGCSFEARAGMTFRFDYWGP